jgi:hypothetical protein
MTLAERRRRSAALVGRLQLVREQLNVALRSMNYERALICQLEVDNLQSETTHVGRRTWHSNPAPRRGGTPASGKQALVDAKAGC